MDVRESTLEVRRFDNPDRINSRNAQTMESIEIGENIITRIVMEPGWRWSKDIKPEVKTELCEVKHFGYMLSGKLHVVMADGTESDIVAGDLFLIPPGHDGWVVGDEPSVWLDIEENSV